MAPAALASPHLLTIGAFTVLVTPHARARRLTLRYNARKACFTLSTPRRAGRAMIGDFLHAQQDWMQGQLAKIAAQPRLVPAGFVLLEGRLRHLVHRDGAGVTIESTEDSLIVTCRIARLPRAVLRFLQREALARITALVHAKAAQIGRDVGAVTLRDTASRWGSCAHNGNLSFSWRLIMAPPATLDYVVAHEVAHLRHFDHSPAFWALCRELSADYVAGKHWLKQNGAALQQVTV